MSLSPAEFSKVVRRYFDVIADDALMECVTESQREVRYQNSRDFLAIRYDYGRSFEVYVQLGRRLPADESKSISLADFLSISRFSDETKLSGTMASTSASLDEVIMNVSRLTKSYAMKFFLKDDSSLEVAIQMILAHNSDSVFSRKFTLISAQADIAWKSGDFDSVVKLLSEIEGHASKSQLKKLSFARRQLSNQ